jgi:hypothetical protein
MPQLAAQQARLRDGRILFRDRGFAPILSSESITLGPGQLALVGFGRYSDAAFDLGIGDGDAIPQSIRSLRARFAPASGEEDTARPDTIETTVRPPANGDLRIVLRRLDEHNKLARAVSSDTMADFFAIEAFQDGHALPVAINYDKIIWTGLAWAVGEIRRSDIAPGKPIELRLSTPDQEPAVHLTGQVFSVKY